MPKVPWISSPALSKLQTGRLRPERRCHFFQKMQWVYAETCSVNNSGKPAPLLSSITASAQRDWALLFQEMLCSTLVSIWRCHPLSVPRPQGFVRLGSHDSMGANQNLSLRSLLLKEEFHFLILAVWPWLDPEVLSFLMHKIKIVIFFTDTYEDQMSFIDWAKK